MAVSCAPPQKDITKENIYNSVKNSGVLVGSPPPPPPPKKKKDIKKNIYNSVKNSGVLGGGSLLDFFFSFKAYRHCTHRSSTFPPYTIIAWEITFCCDIASFKL